MGSRERKMPEQFKGVCLCICVLHLCLEVAIGKPLPTELMQMTAKWELRIGLLTRAEVGPTYVHPWQH